MTKKSAKRNQGGGGFGGGWDGSALIEGGKRRISQNRERGKQDYLP